MGIEICSKQKVYKDAINKFQINQGKEPLPSNGPGSRPFSKEAFIDALISWIVTDDQVLTISI